MKIIVCVDDREGMLFNNRRVSSDQRLIENILEETSGKIWVDPYSASLFEKYPDRICVSENCLIQAEEGAYCFVEREDLSPVAERVEEVVLYRFNRRYPADVHFPRALFENRWKLTETFEFAGKSHLQITREVYAL